MKFEKIKGEVSEKDMEKLSKWLASATGNLNNGKWEIVIKKPVRTTPQHRGMWLFCHWIATMLNEINMPFSQKFIKWFFKEDFKIGWNKDMTKRLIWDPVMKNITGKHSSTKLTTKEHPEISGVIQDHFGTLGIALTFPNIEDLQNDVKKWEILKKIT